MPIESMKQYARMKYQGEVTSSARKVLLFNHRKQIVQQINTLQENLKAIDKKIEFYINKEKNNGS